MCTRTHVHTYKHTHTHTNWPVQEVLDGSTQHIYIFIYIYIHVYVYMQVCMHACMCVCVYVCMHVCMYVCVCVSIFPSIYLSINPPISLSNALAVGVKDLLYTPEPLAAELNVTQPIEPLLLLCRGRALHERRSAGWVEIFQF
jgi:hypothetical protein